MQNGDKGGSYAIQGFNYQKSVAMLIAVLHFLSEGKFELSVEADDDIVVTGESGVTYIQAKKSEMSLTKITARYGGKDSILEKNLRYGGLSDNYKIVTPSYKDSPKNLENTSARILTQGARVYRYNQNTLDAIAVKLPGIVPDKLEKSTLALTLFNEDQDEALAIIQGVMTSLEISVDNGHGLRSLDELSRQIDRRSAIVASDETDMLRKTFTKEDLSAIFSHSKKLVHFEDILNKLNYSTAKRNALREKRILIGVIHDYEYSAAKKFIENLDVMALDESEIITRAFSDLSFKGVNDDIEREAIVIDALSQVIYEGKYI